jgi:carbon storage regulator CsrA
MERANAKVRGLVLTRHPGERIVIGPDITVEVVEVRSFGKGCAVRLRVVAPPDVVVDREEVSQARLRAEGGAA